MSFLARLYSNHVLTNLVFVLVLVVGVLSYLQMPREQDPTINFNWLDISTVAPGMAAEDVEKRVTNVLEDGIRLISDVKFVSSRSREGFSNILVRFDDLAPRVFDKRVIDLRREIQNREQQMPEGVESPFVFEVTTANAFPTATVLVVGNADDEILRAQAELVKKGLERIKGVDRILDTALRQPEMQVKFDPARLADLNIAPSQLADTVALQYRSLSAGSLELGSESWLVRLMEREISADSLREAPVLGTQARITVGDVAEVQPGWEKPRHAVLWGGKPAVMLAVTKREAANTLDLVARVKDYIARSEVAREAAGVQVMLADDQTEITRSALDIMQKNAGIGLLMVLLVVWLFLGFKIAFLTAIAIPFILAGTFWVLSSMGETLNVMVLLGVVISLGMLVDDAVVVVESIYYRLQRGAEGLAASVEGLREVIAPVTTAVFTTMAAFLPLMLLPGILGKFMKMVPLVVTVALAISLIEAYWILPSHILGAKRKPRSTAGKRSVRARGLHKLRLIYARLLVWVMRRPKRFLALGVVLFIAAFMSAMVGQANPALMQDERVNKFLVKTDFFASDPLRLFYINAEMENGTPLAATLESVKRVQAVISATVPQREVRSVVGYAGQMFTETAPLQGAHYGQVLVSLKPGNEGSLSVDAVIDSLRAKVAQIAGPKKISFLRLAGGPPAGKAVSVKVRGDEFDELRAGAAQIRAFLEKAGWAKDITDDDLPGVQEMRLRVDDEAVRRSGANMADVMRTLRMLVDGEVVAESRHNGERIYFRVMRVEAASGGAGDVQAVEDLLAVRVSLPGGNTVPLSYLLRHELDVGQSSIRHHNFRRAITVEADIDKAKIDTPQANQYLKDQWAEMQADYPTLDLDFSGQLDDLNESLGSIGKLMLFGVLLMYVILGTQFKSYFQPLMILVTVPMAFTGVVIGLLVTQNPLSLFTLYGVVALAGIAVNAAIVLISAANDRLAAGMSVSHATIYAARRRVVPILITSLTTVAGLFSLATGLGGESLLWGPVATAIVWGLVVSTLLTLFLVPTIYRLFMRFSQKARTQG